MRSPISNPTRGPKPAKLRLPLALAACAGFVLLAGALPARAEEPATVRLWEGKAPGERAPIAAEVDTPPPAGQKGDFQRVTNVSDPTLTVFPAPKDKANGAALIIAPGGAYQFLSWEMEGTEIARRFNQDGVTAFVLKYRVPKRDFDPETRLPLMDAQRSVSLVRARAKEWGLDPARIGFLGFSAGGHLGANLAGKLEQRAYDAADDIDKASCRPDFTVLIYPGGLLDPKDHTQISAAFPVSAKTPPTFLAAAGDDEHCSECCIRYYLKLREAGVKAELHIFRGGVHGFGMRPRGGAAASWPDRCAAWMRDSGYLR